MGNIILDKEKKYKNIHFIGIGGVNMNCLAQILKSSGYVVSGSDQNESATTRRLQSLGIEVTIGHSKENINNKMNLIVYTAAVKQDNCELVTAKNMNIDTMDRAALLGLIMKIYKYPICVSGTHGKTSTTSMITQIFLQAKKDPTALVGAHFDAINGTLKEGGRDYMIVESCEYFDSFLRFHPYIGIVLNLEADHLDYFKDIHAIRNSFRKFAELVPKEGALVINGEIEQVQDITQGLECKVITFGMQDANWTANNINYNEKGCPQFDVLLDGKIKGAINLSVYGEYNILNALAAIATSYELGIDFADIAKGLNEFTGAKRRFQYKGTINGIKIIDDYAHHPTEIEGTLKSARNIPNNNIWCVFQPHTHSRTKSLLKQFSQSFDEADKIIIVDIYSPAGREEESTHIHSSELVELIKKRGREVYYISSFSEAENFLFENCVHNDLLITMGAGNIYLVGENMLNRSNLEK